MARRMRTRDLALFMWMAMAQFFAATMLLPMAMRAQAPASDKIETPQLEFVFEEAVTLAPSVHTGKTPLGERNIEPITGGTFSGPNIKGTVMPGGWDLAVDRWRLHQPQGRLHAENR